MTQLRNEIIWRTVDGRVIGLDLRSSRYFSLNGTAATLWPSLLRDAGLIELRDHLVEEFGADPAEAEADVDAFLDQLRAEGLLVD